MSLICCICRNLLLVKCKIYTAQCGHLFHELCVFERKTTNNSCPECGCQPLQLRRVDFDIESGEDSDDEELELATAVYESRALEKEAEQLRQELERVKLMEKEAHESLERERKRLEAKREERRKLREEVAELQILKEAMPKVPRQTVLLWQLKVEKLSHVKEALQASKPRCRELIARTPVTQVALDALREKVYTLKSNFDHFKRRCKELDELKEEMAKNPKPPPPARTDRTTQTYKALRCSKPPKFPRSPERLQPSTSGLQRRIRPFFVYMGNRPLYRRSSSGSSGSDEEPNKHVASGSRNYEACRNKNYDSCRNKNFEGCRKENYESSRSNNYEGCRKKELPPKSKEIRAPGIPNRQLAGRPSTIAERPRLRMNARVINTAPPFPVRAPSVDHERFPLEQWQILQTRQLKYDKFFDKNHKFSLFPPKNSS